MCGALLAKGNTVSPPLYTVLGRIVVLELPLGERKKNKTGRKIQTRYLCSVNYTKKRGKKKNKTKLYSIKTTDIHSLCVGVCFFLPLGY